MAGNVCCLSGWSNPYSAGCCVLTRGIALVGCGVSAAQLTHASTNTKGKSGLTNTVDIGSAGLGVANNCVQAATGGTIFGHADKKYHLTAKAIGAFKKAGRGVGRIVRGKRAANGTTTAEETPKKISTSFAARHMPEDASKIKLMVKSVKDLYDFCRKRSRNVKMNKQFYDFHLGLKKVVAVAKASGSKNIRQALTRTHPETTVKHLPVCANDAAAGGPNHMLHHSGGEAYDPLFQPCRLHPPSLEETLKLGGGLTNDGPAERSAKATTHCENKMTVGTRHVMRLSSLLMGDVMNTFNKKKLKAATEALTKKHEQELKALNRAKAQAKKARRARSVTLDELLEAVIVE